MNKKIISVLAILATLTCALFAASTRKDIDAFLKEYETFVVKAEKAAASNKISDLMSMSLESVKLAEKYDKMLLIGFVEHEQSPDLFTMHEISELPTVIIFEDGKPYRPLVGEYTIQKVEAYIRRFFGLYPYEI